MSEEQVGIRISLTGDGSGVKAVVQGARRDFDSLAKSGVRSGQQIHRQFGNTRAGLQSVSQQLQRSRQELIAFFSVRYAAGQARALIDIADAAKTIDARLKLATKTSQEYETASRAVFEISKRSRTGIQSTANLYAKLAVSMRQMGASQTQVLGITESVTQAIKLSGVSTMAADAAVTQFTQAMASGVLRGDEFRSIMEQAPRLMAALSDGLGVAQGELRGLAEQGKLTADVVINALSSQSEKLTQEFTQLPLTVGGALTQMHTDLVQNVASLDAATGSSAALADGIQWATQNMDLLAGVVVTVSAAVAGKYAYSIGLATAAQVKHVAAVRLAAAVKLESMQIEAAVAARHLQTAQALAAETRGFAKLTAVEKVWAAQRRNNMAAEALATASTARKAAGLGRLAGLLAMVGGPAGLLVGGATALALWSFSADSAAEKTGDLAGETNELAKAMGNVQSDGISRQVESTTAAIASAGQKIDWYRQRIELIQKNGGNRAGVEHFQNQIELQKQEISSLNQQLDQLAETRKRIDGISESAGKKKGPKEKKIDLSQTLAALESQRKSLGMSRAELTVYNAAVAVAGAENKTLALEVLSSAQALAAAQEKLDSEQRLERQKQISAQRYAGVVQSLFTEEQALADSYQRQAEITVLAHDDKLISETQMYERLLQLEGWYQKESSRIQQQGMNADQKLWASGWKGKAQVLSQSMGQVSQLMMAGSKRQFEIGKKLARASIGASTAAAVMSALEVKPYPLGAALAIGAAAKGALQLRNLNSTTFGGGAAVNAGVASAASAPIPVFSASPATGAPLHSGESESTRRQFQINMYGDQYGVDDLRAMMADVLKVGIDEFDMEIISRDSRQMETIVSAVNRAA